MAEGPSTPFTLVVPPTETTPAILTGFSPVGTISGAPPIINPDPFWRPWACGNGRIWIHGIVDSQSPPVASMEFKVNGSYWIDLKSGTLNPGDEYTLPIVGDDPSEWGTEQPVMGIGVGDYFTGVVSWPPTFVYVNGVRINKAADISELTSLVSLWFYDPITNELSVSTQGGFPPLAVESVFDPVFTPGNTYSIEVRAIGENGDITTMHIEEFMWIFFTRNEVFRWNRIVLPSVYRDDPLMQSVYTACAKRSADFQVFFEDISSQFFPQFATWSLQWWEMQVGLPMKPTLSMEDRRSLVLARRSQDGSKENFFADIMAVAGTDLLVQEFYGEHRIVIRVPDESTRASIENLANLIKPAGVKITVSYSAFRADISAAEDAL